MTSDYWLQAATSKLKAAGISTARLDSLILLEDATGHDKAYLLSHPSINVIGPTYHKLETQLEKRINHEPLAYIRGKTEFYGREFLIDHRVLEPRPESETMIDLLKKVVIGPTYHIIDVGTGSGALAITAKVEFPKSEVTAIDIDTGCLIVARKNAKKHAVDIKFYQGDLLEPLTVKDNLPTAILANLPYVPNDLTINQAAMNEPKIAIFGGSDGLDLYRKLFDQITAQSQKPTYILTESLPFQHEKLATIAQQSGYQLQTTDDFIQFFAKI